MPEETFPTMPTSAPSRGVRPLLLIIGSIVFAILVGIGVYTWQATVNRTNQDDLSNQIASLRDQLQKTQATATPTATPKASASPSASAATSVTYTNTTPAKLTFQHPLEWVLTETTGCEGGCFTSIKPYAVKSSVIGAPLIPLPMGITANQVESTATVDSVITTKYRDQNYSVQHVVDFLIGKDKLKGKKFDDGGGLGGTTNYYVLVTNNMAYTFSILDDTNKYKTGFDQILSTFAPLK